MALTLSTIISRVNKKIQNAQGKLGGQTEIIAIINEAQRDIQSRVDFISAKKEGTPTLIMNNIWEYPLDADVSYDKIIEARFEDEFTDLNKAQFQRSPAKFFFNASNPFLSNGYGDNYRGGSDDRNLRNPLGPSDFEKIAIEFDNGNPYLMVRMIEGKSTVDINKCNTYDGDGTWVIGGDTSEVRTNNQNFRSGSGSVEFLSAGAATDVTVTNSTILTPLDLTDYLNKGIATLELEILSTTMPDDVELRWGSDSSNYYSVTVTARHNGLAFKEGWNSLGFNWKDVTVTGTPVITAIDYVEVTVNNTAALAATYRLDNIVMSLGRDCTLKYYSDYLVVADDGTRKAEFTVTDDSTILQEKEVNMLVWSAARIANQQLRQWVEGDRLELELQRMVQDYKDAQPSQEEPSSLSYYII